jgi:hypothetical protein
MRPRKAVSMDWVITFSTGQGGRYSFLVALHSEGWKWRLRPSSSWRPARCHAGRYQTCSCNVMLLLAGGRRSAFVFPSYLWGEPCHREEDRSSLAVLRGQESVLLNANAHGAFKGVPCRTGACGTCTPFELRRWNSQMTRQPFPPALIAPR